MEVKSYTLEELELHINPLFSDNQNVVPLSPLRLRSYLNNPRAKKDDPVLYEAWYEDRIVAYRTLLPDCYHDSEGRSQRFAWLSGNWVDPGFRRQGLSTKLLKLAEEQWDCNLIYTNYAPASKAVYDATESFSEAACREGNRFYLRAASKELLGKRLGFSPILGVADKIVNSLRERSLLRSNPVTGEPDQIKQIHRMDRDVSRLVEHQLAQTLFRRDTKVLSWIMEYPWITDKKVNPLNYHFSYISNRFENILFRIDSHKAGSEAILWLVINNNKLSVPYLFTGLRPNYSQIAEIILQTMITRDIAHLTIRKPELVEALISYRGMFLSVRPMPQRVFAHKAIADKIPGDLVIHDGDGDVAFTG